MSDFTIRIDIEAPQTTVFDYIADATLTPQWYEGGPGSDQDD